MLGGHAVGRGRRAEREEERRRKEMAQQRTLQHDAAVRMFDRQTRVGLQQAGVAAQKERDEFLAGQRMGLEEYRTKQQLERDVARYGHEMQIQQAIARRQAENLETAWGYRTRESAAEREMQMLEDQLSGLNEAVVTEFGRIDPANLPDIGRKEYQRISNAYAAAMSTRQPEDRLHYLSQIHKDLSKAKFDEQRRYAPTPEDIGKQAVYWDKEGQKYTIEYRSGQPLLRPVKTDGQQPRTFEESIQEPGSFEKAWRAARGEIAEDLEGREADLKTLERMRERFGLWQEAMGGSADQQDDFGERMKAWAQEQLAPFQESSAGPEAVVRVASQSEFEAIPSGTLFRDPEGNLRRKP